MINHTRDIYDPIKSPFLEETEEDGAVSVTVQGIFEKVSVTFL